MPTTGLNDPMIRVALERQLLQENPAVRLRHEMGVGKCVADLVAVDYNEIHIYEIKSDRDGLGRLLERQTRGRRGRVRTRCGQIEAYSAVADRVILVVGLVLLERALPLIPPWWGVVVAVEESDGVVLALHRPAAPNPKQNWTALERVLWRAEAQNLCEVLGIARGVRGSSRVKLRKRLRERGVTLDQLRTGVVGALRSRSWRDEPSR